MLILLYTALLISIHYFSIGICQSQGPCITGSLGLAYANGEVCKYIPHCSIVGIIVKRSGTMAVLTGSFTQVNNYTYLNFGQ